MPLPLPEGKKIHLSYVEHSYDFAMPTMAIASDHYSLNFILHGDRSLVTLTKQYTLHPGDILTMEPFLYHKTLPASKDYYERILIKFSPDYVEPLVNMIGPQLLEQVFSTPVKHFAPEVSSRMETIVRSMYQEYTNDDSQYGPWRICCMLYDLLLTIADYQLSEKQDAVEKTHLTEPIINAIYYMENNFMKPLKLEDVAEECGYSPAYFSRLFQSQLNISFSEYMDDIRLRHVKSLLISTNKSITDIAFETGFKYPGNMTTLFKKVYDITPMAFRKNHE